ncbi:hypothetical protein CXG81DRAFT_26942 [Caulochytrium protostelioides]|uniref:Uncharacterized protein n=1 Tax=Caulochytrium protostelioides TaxID=1555241 RepID=A0A4P9X5F2_9FUNG|nr:hypothetical protein CXG81DRAFT_26942 [Caulochytrium protostelioides]|eukprot:RKP00354.1 hypothetical protein CXG81DRAFT_26942 [Caulochytrium protostelioides]
MRTHAEDGIAASQLLQSPLYALTGQLVSATAYPCVFPDPAAADSDAAPPRSAPRPPPTTAVGAGDGAGADAGGPPWPSPVRYASGAYDAPYELAAWWYALLGPPHRCWPFHPIPRLRADHRASAADAAGMNAHKRYAAGDPAPTASGASAASAAATAAATGAAAGMNVPPLSAPSSSSASATAHAAAGKSTGAESLEPVVRGLTSNLLDNNNTTGNWAHLVVVLLTLLRTARQAEYDWRGTAAAARRSPVPPPRSPTPVSPPRPVLEPSPSLHPLTALPPASASVASAPASPPLPSAQPASAEPSWLRSSSTAPQDTSPSAPPPSAPPSAPPPLSAPPPTVPLAVPIDRLAAGYALRNALRLHRLLTAVALEHVPSKEVAEAWDADRLTARARPATPAGPSTRTPPPPPSEAAAAAAAAAPVTLAIPAEPRTLPPRARTPPPYARAGLVDTMSARRASFGYDTPPRLSPAMKLFHAGGGSSGGSNTGGGGAGISLSGGHHGHHAATAGTAPAPVSLLVDPAVLRDVQADRRPRADQLLDELCQLLATMTPGGARSASAPGSKHIALDIEIYTDAMLLLLRMLLPADADAEEVDQRVAMAGLGDASGAVGFGLGLSPLLPMSPTLAAPLQDRVSYFAEVLGHRLPHFCVDLVPPLLSRATFDVDRLERLINAPAGAGGAHPDAGAGGGTLSHLPFSAGILGAHTASSWWSWISGGSGGNSNSSGGGGGGGGGGGTPPGSGPTARSLATLAARSPSTAASPVASAFPSGTDLASPPDAAASTPRTTAPTAPGAEASAYSSTGSLADATTATPLSAAASATDRAAALDASARVLRCLVRPQVTDWLPDAIRRAFLGAARALLLTLVTLPDSCFVPRPAAALTVDDLAGQRGGVRHVVANPVWDLWTQLGETTTAAAAATAPAAQEPAHSAESLVSPESAGTRARSPSSPSRLAMTPRVDPLSPAVRASFKAMLSLLLDPLMVLPASGAVPAAAAHTGLSAVAMAGVDRFEDYAGLILFHAALDQPTAASGVPGVAADGTLADPAAWRSRMNRPTLKTYLLARTDPDSFLVPLCARLTAWSHASHSVSTSHGPHDVSELQYGIEPAHAMGIYLVLSLLIRLSQDALWVSGLWRTMTIAPLFLTDPAAALQPPVPPGAFRGGGTAHTLYFPGSGAAGAAAIVAAAAGRGSTATNTGASPRAAGTHGAASRLGVVGGNAATTPSDSAAAIIAVATSPIANSPWSTQDILLYALLGALQRNLVRARDLALHHAILSELTLLCQHARHVRLHVVDRFLALVTWCVRRRALYQHHQQQKSGAPTPVLTSDAPPTPMDAHRSPGGSRRASLAASYAWGGHDPMPPPPMSPSSMAPTDEASIIDATLTLLLSQLTRFLLAHPRSASQWVYGVLQRGAGILWGYPTAEAPQPQPQPQPHPPPAPAAPPHDAAHPAGAPGVPPIPALPRPPDVAARLGDAAWHAWRPGHAHVAQLRRAVVGQLTSGSAAAAAASATAAAAAAAAAAASSTTAAAAAATPAPMSPTDAADDGGLAQAAAEAACAAAEADVIGRFSAAESLSALVAVLHRFPDSEVVAASGPSGLRSPEVLPERQSLDGGRAGGGSEPHWVSHPHVRACARDLYLLTCEPPQGL